MMGAAPVTHLSLTHQMLAHVSHCECPTNAAPLHVRDVQDMQDAHDMQDVQDMPDTQDLLCQLQMQPLETTTESAVTKCRS